MVVVVVVAVVAVGAWGRFWEGGGTAVCDLDAIRQERPPPLHPTDHRATCDCVSARQPSRMPTPHPSRTSAQGRAAAVRTAHAAPIREQLVQRARLKNVAGQDVRAHLGALLHDAHAKVLAVGGGKLL